MNTVWDINIELTYDNKLKIGMIVEESGKEYFTSNVDVVINITSAPSPTELIDYIKEQANADASDFSEYITMELIEIEHILFIRNNPYIDTYGDIEATSFVVTNSGASTDIKIGGFELTYYHKSDELVFKDDYLHNEEIKYNNEVLFKLNIERSVAELLHKNAAYILTN